MVKKYNQFIIKDLATKNPLEQWGAGAIITLTEMIREESQKPIEEQKFK